MNALRWTMRVVGAALIVVTVGVAGYARFGGEAARDGFPVRSKTDYYLVASGAVAHCTVGGERVTVPPLGPREVLDGVRVEPRADGSPPAKMATSR